MTHLKALYKEKRILGKEPTKCEIHEAKLRDKIKRQIDALSFIQLLINYAKSKEEN